MRMGTGVDTWWPKVSLFDPAAARRTRQLLDESLIWFAVPDCEELLTIYGDHEGRTLKENLQLISPSIEHYLGLLYFRDGSGSSFCDTDVFAFTAPGSRVVWICGRTLERNYGLSPRHATASVIHEVLHTLGLGENPPSSREITARVLRQCAR